jgi:hypothetical protein
MDGFASLGGDQIVALIAAFLCLMLVARNIRGLQLRFGQWVSMALIWAVIFLGAVLVVQLALHLT